MSLGSDNQYDKTGTLVIENVRLDIMEAFLHIFSDRTAEEPLSEVLHGVLKKAMDDKVGANTATRMVEEYGDRAKYGVNSAPLQKIFPDANIEPEGFPHLTY